MDNYLLFILIAIATILSPGPGVIMTLTNAIQQGLSGTFSGILGIAFGTFVVATISATSLGLILATSTLAFSIMKFIGAAYLIYLGIKLWRSPSRKVSNELSQTKSKLKQFIGGITLQLTNPKAVFFFMSIFPQFIDLASNYLSQFTLLVVSYSSLVVIIHFAYALLAKSTHHWLSSEKGYRLVNRLGAITFMGFGVGLASTSR